MAVSESDLDRYFELARENHENEQQFFSRLIRAMVYTHAPASDDSKKVRLLQFRHPNGFNAIPFFTTRHRSSRASSSAVRQIHLSCRQLLLSTRGATLMLNPNDGGPVLFPEEVDLLLVNGTLQTFDKVEYSERQWDVRPAESLPPVLIYGLRYGVASLTFIRSMFLLDRKIIGDGESRADLLIYVGIKGPHGERAARHVVSLIQNMHLKLDRTVDVAIFDVDNKWPEFLAQCGAKSIIGPGIQ